MGLWPWTATVTSLSEAVPFLQVSPATREKPVADGLRSDTSSRENSTSPTEEKEVQPGSWRWCGLPRLPPAWNLCHLHTADLWGPWFSAANYVTYYRSLASSRQMSLGEQNLLQTLLSIPSVQRPPVYANFSRTANLRFGRTRKLSRSRPCHLGCGNRLPLKVTLYSEI